MSDAYRELGYSGGCQICGSSLHPSQHCAEVMYETRKESAALAQLLEQERANNAALKKELGYATLRAEQAKKLYDMTLANEIRWMHKHEEATAAIEEMREGMDYAWTVIANAHGGNWELANPDWQKAAAKWRDECFAPVSSRTVREAIDADRRAALAPDAGSGRADPQPPRGDYPERDA